MLKAFNSKRKKGFTLIELLVVIAILGILVLLAAPRFLNQTDKAREAATNADIKVVSNAALIHGIHDGDLPTASEPEVIIDNVTLKRIDFEHKNSEGEAFSQNIQSTNANTSRFFIVTESEKTDIQKGDVFIANGNVGEDGEVTDITEYVGLNGKVLSVTGD